jgi:hypothetical protein
MWSESQDMATNVPNYVLVLQLEQVLCPVLFHSLFEDQLGSSFVAMCREDPLSPEEDNKVLVTLPARINHTPPP